MKSSILAAAFAVTALAGTAASAATYNFGGLGGNLGADELFSDTTATSSLLATALNTEQPPAPQLHQNIFGLGVNLGSGDSDQLDSDGDDEGIVFDFGGLATLESITLNLISSFPILGQDEYRLYGSNDAAVVACTTGGLACITSVSTLIASGLGNGIEGSITVDLTGVATAFRYLIATIPAGTNDDYRVGSLSATAVPVPAALPLMASAIAGFAAAARARRKKSNA